METQIQFGSTTSLSIAKKPITVATFIYALVSVVLYALLVSRSVIHSGGFWGISLFTVGYLASYWVLLTRTPTLNYKVTYVPVLFRYLSKKRRRVKTAFLDEGAPLRNLLGIEPQGGVRDDGLISFTDGEKGYLLDVVGNASSMLFDNDRNSVIRDARVLYKNLPSMVGITVITQASTQDVHIQLQSKVEQLNNLAIDSPGLRQIVKRQGQVLRDTVGSNFSMIRQYILVRGNLDGLTDTTRQIMNAAGSSQNNFLKEAHILQNQKPRYSQNGMAINEPYQVERLLRSIFDDYQDQKKPRKYQVKDVA